MAGRPAERREGHRHRNEGNRSSSTTKAVETPQRQDGGAISWLVRQNEKATAPRRGDGFVVEGARAPRYAAAPRFATLAIVAREHPNARSIADQEFARLQHRRDACVSAHVFRSTAIESFSLRLGDALGLATTAIFEIFARDGREHVQQHGIDAVNILPVKSSAGAAIIQLVGRSIATTRICLASSSARSFVQSGP